MADAMTRYATTPKPDRQKFATLAAKANIQFTMLLLDAGQIDGAQRMVKMLGRDEAALRADPTLRGQANQARALVAQTATMMQDLGEKWNLLARSTSGPAPDAAAVMPLYLYARFVHPDPDLANELLARRGTSAVGNLDKLLRLAQSDPLSAYDVGDALRRAVQGEGGAALPEGVLKHRVLYAAWQYYDAFLKCPATENQRVKRTLAGIAMQGLSTDGAHGPPVIRPFDAPAPATQPATAPASPVAATNPAGAGGGSLPHGRGSDLPGSLPHGRGSDLPGRSTDSAAPGASRPSTRPRPADGTPDHPVG